MPVEPVIPAMFTLWGIVLLAFWAVLLVFALVTVAKSSSLTAVQRVIWAVAIVAMPVLGALAWTATYVVELSARRHHHVD